MSINVQTWEGGRGVGVPSDALRFLVGQELADFRLATCFFRSLVAGLIVFLGADKVEIVSQCERCQYMCRLGRAGEAQEYRAMP